MTARRIVGASILLVSAGIGGLFGPWWGVLSLGAQGLIYGAAAIGGPRPGPDLWAEDDQRLPWD